MLVGLKAFKVRQDQLVLLVLLGLLVMLAKMGLKVHREFLGLVDLLDLKDRLDLMVLPDHKVELSFMELLLLQVEPE